LLLIQKHKMSAIKFPSEYQYLLIISPTTIVTQKAMALKRDFAERFKFDAPLKSKPHISVLHRSIDEQQQDAFVAEIKRFLADVYAFRVKLSGITGFPPHTVYIKVLKEGLALKQFIAALKNSKFKESIKMHLTIARGLDQELYNRAVRHYAQIPFEDTFTVKSLILLKRKNEKETYKQIFEFELNEAPSLFGD
jgi:hypothetical protein